MSTVIRVLEVLVVAGTIYALATRSWVAAGLLIIVLAAIVFVFGARLTSRKED